MRIVAGIYRSRVLKSAKGLKLRPTSDRLRETLFDVLSASVEGARFLDLFAGTGAIGIEALSRGAQEAVFIEKHARTAELIRDNLKLLGIHSGAKVIVADALAGLEKLSAAEPAHRSAFDFVFLDPPYAAAEEYRRILEFLERTPVVAAEGIVIAEHHHKFDLPEEIGSLRRVRVLRQGDAALSFFRKSSTRVVKISKH